MRFDVEIPTRERIAGKFHARVFCVCCVAMRIMFMPTVLVWMFYFSSLHFLLKGNRFGFFSCYATVHNLVTSRHDLSSYHIAANIAHNVKCISGNSPANDVKQIEFREAK